MWHDSRLRPSGCILLIFVCPYTERSASTLDRRWAHGIAVGVLEAVGAAITVAVHLLLVRWQHPVQPGDSLPGLELANVTVVRSALREGPTIAPTSDVADASPRAWVCATRESLIGNAPGPYDSGRVQTSQDALTDLRWVMCEAGTVGFHMSARTVTRSWSVLPAPTPDSRRDQSLADDQTAVTVTSQLSTLNFPVQLRLLFQPCANHLSPRKKLGAAIL